MIRSKNNKLHGSASVIFFVKMSTSPVPQRYFGRSLKKKREHALPDMVPIIGLGCSSFSTFFWTHKDDTDEETKRSNNNNNDDDKDQCFSAETLQKDHPIVQGWISTIHYAIIECDIKLLDTAPWYGHGTSEIVLGWALQELLEPTPTTGLLLLSSELPTPPKRIIQREHLCINTKVGRYEADPKHQFDFSRETTIASVQRSLQRLGGGTTTTTGTQSIIGYIDVLQLHDPEFSPSLEVLIEETIPAMMECRSRGWCKALGLTGCTCVSYRENELVYCVCVCVCHYSVLFLFWPTSPLKHHYPMIHHYYLKQIPWKCNIKCFKQQ
jgi:diketogulonate reductase-like aldo/keto reductase